MNEFGKRLKKIREEKGLTHAELGATVGSTISHFVVLASTWAAGGILALFIYGMGKNYELQENINYHLQEIDGKLNKQYQVLRLQGLFFVQFVCFIK